MINTTLSQNVYFVISCTLYQRFRAVCSFVEGSQFREKLKNSGGEKYLNIYSPFRYLMFEITGAHRIICPLFDA
jgi:hypothetical protein